MTEIPGVVIRGLAGTVPPFSCLLTIKEWRLNQS